MFSVLHNALCLKVTWLKGIWKLWFLIFDFQNRLDVRLTCLENLGLILGASGNHCEHMLN